MKFGSVCSGIESASVAWEPLGLKAAWFAEIEAFPAAVLARHWPNVANFGDMGVLPYLVSQGLVEAPDILVGGTPCQAFSVAGLRKGMGDERGQLTMKFVELANEIDNKRPGDECVVCWENVPGVLSSKDNAFGCFLGALAGEDEPLQSAGPRWSNAGCVYGPQRTIAWRVLDAQYFGVAQRRRRVFVVASARDGFDPATVLFEREGVRRDFAPSREAQQDITGDVATRIRRPSHWDGGPHPTLNQSHNTGGIGASNQELFSQRGAGLVAQASPIQNATRGKSQNGLGIGSPSEPMYTLDQGSQHAVVVHATQDPCISHDLAFALGRNQGGGNALSIQGSMIGRKEAAGPSGSGLNNEVSFTLNTIDQHGVALGGDVRRLTPVECERLQGFADNHTLVPFGRVVKPEKLEADYAKYLMRGGERTFEDCLRVASDGHRYKAIGNSKAVPVIRFVGARIQQELVE